MNTINTGWILLTSLNFPDFNRAICCIHCVFHFAEKDLKVIITRRTGVEKIHFNSSMEDAKLNETVDLKCSLNQEPRYENSDSSDDCNEKYNSKLIKRVKVKGN